MQLYLDVRGSREEHFRRFPLVSGRTWMAGRYVHQGGPLVNGRYLRTAGPLLDKDEYVPLEDYPAISRYHFQAGSDDTGGWVRDNHSSNGTRLNGSRIGSGRNYPLRPGDLIQVCDCLVRVAATASVDPGWLSWNGGVVLRLARTISEMGRVDTFPILADALEEAGCMDADILGHCRQTGEHCRQTGEYVRGCWVIELILGKR